MKLSSIRNIVFLAIAVIAFGICAPQIFDTVNKGSYQIKQAAVSGTMDAKMDPGLWLQLFGDIETWPKAETFFFTADAAEGGQHDQSIKVRFNDGSEANISGTLRVVMPTDKAEAINIVTGLGYRTYKDVESKLLLPLTRNALRMTANLMTARESYAERRPDFNHYAWDQIQNGIYVTYDETETYIDPITGKEAVRTIKKIQMKKDGTPVYQTNPLHGTGIQLANFETKDFVYSDKVKAQIAQQQEALMAVATARANAEKAKQDAKTAEEQGKAEVMKARYEKEQEKIRAVVDAEKAKEVAELDAARQLSVAKLEKAAAAELKQKLIFEGQGEAEKKALVLNADGALAQKLDAYVKSQALWAEAFAKRNVPSVFTAGNDGKGGGSGSPDSQFQQFMQLQNMKNMSDLGLDMSIRAGKTTK